MHWYCLLRANMTVTGYLDALLVIDRMNIPCLLPSASPFGSIPIPLLAIKADMSHLDFSRGVLAVLASTFLRILSGINI